ncbi:MAG: hypothetical protein J3K34DRAFT_479949 [Monoraphidium minutum]|nr:MAG: hypothetical protein J3K34DRAFT_479949 [Monoraphidium minutum]
MAMPPPPLPRRRRGPAPAAAAGWWLLAALAALAAAALPAAAAAEAANNYNPWSYNRACKYTAKAVPAPLFLDSIDGGDTFLFPLESDAAVKKYERPWEACFGPSETYSLAAIAAGRKLPCRYRFNEDGAGGYDYEEEHACDMLVKTNCYCYALDRFVGSYCEPGLGGTGEPFKMPVDSCERPRAGVLADGGKLVDSAVVYGGPPPEGGHYIALAVKPAKGSDTGDFHFWRLDTNGGWSYKAGDTLVRNTLRNGTYISNIESDELARGAYTEFCGYFFVEPSKHKLAGNAFWYSDLPKRFSRWAKHGIASSVTPLSLLPAGWLMAYNDYFAESGWEDPPQRESPPRGKPWSLEDALAAGKERAAAPAPVSAGAGRGRAAARRAPHWYSSRPAAGAAAAAPRDRRRA